jgi:amidase
VLTGRPTLAQASDDAGPLRIAVSTTAPVPGVRVEPAWADGTEQVAGLLEAAGHHVMQRTPPTPWADGLHVMAIWGLGAGGDEGVAILPGADPAAFETRTHRHARMGRTLARLGFGDPGARQALRERLLAFFGDVDVLVTPTLAHSAVDASGWPARGWLRSVRTAVEFAPFTGAWNAAGVPALTIPVGRTSDGLPIGVQLVGPPGSEARLLALARLVERARPWPRHAPGVAAAGGAS